MIEPITVILIDDDDINNFISEEVIKKVAQNATFYSFTDARKALDFISDTFSAMPGTSELVVLLLDMNMPTLTGMKFLEAFENMNIRNQDLFNIFILSNSIYPGDKDMFLGHRLVTDYILKPFSSEKAMSVFEKINERQKK